jgi:HAE1 family hydrophobic/amphiphilic exporter-1
VIASGAGSGARQALGTAIFGGMLFSTFLNLIITPVLYVVIKGFELRGTHGRIPMVPPAATIETAQQPLVSPT